MADEPSSSHADLFHKDEDFNSDYKNYNPNYEGMNNQDQNTSGELIMEQERLLPIANIQRIMRRVVPEEGKLSKESKDLVQECVSEFIQFVVSEASDHCLEEKRKTISCEDLLKALRDLGFDPYVNVLKRYIENYRLALGKPSQPINLEPSKPSTSGVCSVHNHSPGEVPTLTLRATSETPSFVCQPEQPQEQQQEAQQDNNDPQSLEQVQVFIDSQSGQHYMAVRDPQTGEDRLIPVSLNVDQLAQQAEE
ncbi:unnamed protein product [Bursaphelenchus okinawaensis]|uniref:Transcription factor CBF/NF-Y/archaeal histone domain-containing protein n=1 Tax=Bursaphelenchus okinawaensis TaxID=465554 RepID=A0A811K9E0_9BILA|nr:unnamed protein product [Bursaphelenchus okinawaensis]CAG9095696.1 unnamed protein product [Bursaphelenchus okinawaensis]